MDFSQDAIRDFGSILGIALPYAFISAYHTIICKLLGGLFSFFLRYIFSQTRLFITPSRYIHVTLFCSMPDTLEWVQAAWVLMSRDEPPEGLPGPEVANVVTKGLLLVLYIVDALFWNHAVVILSAIRSHVVLLSCLGIGFVALLPLSAKSFLWFADKKRSERYKDESTFALSLRLFLTVVVCVRVIAYKLCFGALQVLRDLNAYMLEAARPRPEKYRQALANNIYEYEGLNVHSKEIRLIKLRRNLITGVRSSLEHFSSEDAPAYEAVSYTWDSPIKDHLVFFDGCWLPTTRNVYRILLDRASLFRTRWLWIDAVCINQENDAEKSVQVGMMGEIYHGAERVIVWLGDVAVKTSEVIAAMFLLEKLQYNIRNYEQYKLKLDSMELFSGNHESWAALSCLLGHPYWQRMWIIQEVAKARKVHMWYGGQYISWDIFFHMVLHLAFEPGNKIMAQELLFFMKEFKAMKGVAQVNLIGAAREALTHGKLLTFENSLTMTSGCMATDPRDRVFALANLIQLTDIEEHTDVQPDYSLTVQEVYIRTARYILSHHLSFTVLQNGIGYERKVPDLPSWVPDWSSSQPTVDGLNNNAAYQAGGTIGLQSFTFTLSTDRLQLSIQAISISKIKYLSDAAFSLDDGAPDIPSMASFYHAACSTVFSNLLDNDEYAPTHQSLGEAFWRTLIGDRHPVKGGQLGGLGNFQWPADSEYGTHFQIWRDQILGNQEPATYLSMDEARAQSMLVFRMAKRWEVHVVIIEGSRLRRTA